MRTFVASLLFLSFIALSSCLSCWDTKDQFYAMRATNTIDMKTCGSSAKSCKKEWYKASIADLWPLGNLIALPQVVSWGDFYYRLTCDSGAAQAEKSEEKVDVW